VNKLNIFMVNVLRFRGGNDLASLVDQAGSHNKGFDIPVGEDSQGIVGALVEVEPERELELAKRD
jgi:hypothetical protein